MIDNNEFINAYLEAMKNKINDLTHFNLILETKVRLLESQNELMEKDLAKKTKKSDKAAQSADGF